LAILEGSSASPGIAIGPAFILERISLEIPETKSRRSLEYETKRFRRAVADSLDQLNEIHAAAQSRLKKSEAGFFIAQIEVLGEPSFKEGVEKVLSARGLTAESAVAAAAKGIAAKFEKMDSEYSRERAADIRDAAIRVVRNIAGGGKSAKTGSGGAGILIAKELQPADFAFIDPERVTGIAAEKGGAASHASIIARSLGIPCVVGVEGLLAAVRARAHIAVDADSGVVVVEPDDKTISRFTVAARRARGRREAAMKKKHEPALDRSGRRVMVYANAGSLDDMRKAYANGAEGIGLFRTEFIFAGRKAMPTEEEQYEIYAEAARLGDGKPVTIRLLDIGGDKPAEYLSLPKEDNPFLGLRAVRLLLKRRDVLDAQVKAILRAASEGNVMMLVPMIADLDELLAIRAAVSDCKAALRKNGVKVPHVPLGVMIEIPSAALCSHRLARQCDYFSIGTNDLTQYCMAADRGNAAVTRLYRASHPAVMMLVARTIRSAHEAGIKASICGEAAASPVLVPRFAGMEVDALSVSPPLVPEIKECVRKSKPVLNEEF